MSENKLFVIVIVIAIVIVILLFTSPSKRFSWCLDKRYIGLKIPTLLMHFTNWAVTNSIKSTFPLTSTLLFSFVLGLW